MQFTPNGTTHAINSTPITQDVIASANTNKAGKLTNGWNLTGFGSETTGTDTYTAAVCPAGSFVNGLIGPGETTYGPRSVLQVNATGIGTFDLPNTPVG